MPLFFFHYHTPNSVSLDDVGCQFESLEHAYADAYRSAVDLGAELLKAHCNPASHRIVIADAGGADLMEISFDEIFRGVRHVLPRTRQHYPLQREILRERVETAKLLRDDMADMCLAARQSVLKAHEVLRRARAV